MHHLGSQRREGAQEVTVKWTNSSKVGKWSYSPKDYTKVYRRKVLAGLEVQILPNILLILANQKNSNVRATHRQFQQPTKNKTQKGKRKEEIKRRADLQRMLSVSVKCVRFSASLSMGLKSSGFRKSQFSALKDVKSSEATIERRRICINDPNGVGPPYSGSVSEVIILLIRINPGFGTISSSSSIGIGRSGGLGVALHTSGIFGIRKCNSSTA